MKTLLICSVVLLATLTFAGVAHAKVVPSDRTFICSGSDEFGSYFTFSNSPRSDGEELFVVDVSNEEVNDGFPLYILNRTVQNNALSFQLQGETPYELSIDLETGKAIAKGWIEGDINLLCASTNQEVDDVLDFIKANGLPVNDDQN